MHQGRGSRSDAGAAGKRKGKVLPVTPTGEPDSGLWTGPQDASHFSDEPDPRKPRRPGSAARAVRRSTQALTKVSMRGVVCLLAVVVVGTFVLFNTAFKGDAVNYADAEKWAPRVQPWRAGVTVVADVGSAGMQSLEQQTRSLLDPASTGRGSSWASSSWGDKVLQWVSRGRLGATPAPVARMSLGGSTGAPQTVGLPVYAAAGPDVAWNEQAAEERRAREQPLLSEAEVALRSGVKDLRM